MNKNNCSAMDEDVKGVDELTEKNRGMSDEGTSGPTRRAIVALKNNNVL